MNWDSWWGSIFQWQGLKACMTCCRDADLIKPSLHWNGGSTDKSRCLIELSINLWSGLSNAFKKTW